MFSSIYIYPVHHERVADFLRIQSSALQIYREHGAIDDATYKTIDGSARYGCAGFDSTIKTFDGESIYVSVSFFRDRAHHDQVMTLVDNDPRINDLYNEMRAVVDISRIARGEFERVV